MTRWPCTPRTSSPSRQHGRATRALDSLWALGRTPGWAAADRTSVLRERALPSRPRARASTRVRLRADSPEGEHVTALAGKRTSEWEPVIGLEIHVQLKTRTKMFCRCETSFGLEPNVRTCPDRKSTR